MTGRVSSISSGMTQTTLVLSLLPRPIQQRIASSGKHQPHVVARVIYFQSCFFTLRCGFVTLALRFCHSCARINEQKEQKTPRAFEPLLDKDHDSKVCYALACYKGDQFKVGDGVYLHPDAFNFR